jgi:hypothetical protein
MTNTREWLLTVGGLVATVTSGAAAMGIWLLLTQPITVADALNARDLTTIARAMASVLAEAISAVIRYL